MNTVDIIAHLVGIALLLTLTPFFVYQLVAHEHDRIANAQDADAYRLSSWHGDVQYWGRAMESVNPARRRLAADMQSFLWAHNPHREETR